MNFDIPEDIRLFLEEVDGFIEREIKPLENSNDNIRFFDHRREDARTDWERDGLPNEEWEELLRRLSVALSPPVSSVTRFLASTADETAVTLAWPLFASI